MKHLSQTCHKVHHNEISNQLNNTKIKTPNKKTRGGDITQNMKCYLLYKCLSELMVFNSGVQIPQAYWQTIPGIPNHSNINKPPLHTHHCKEPHDISNKSPFVDAFVGFSVTVWSELSTWMKYIFRHIIIISQWGKTHQTAAGLPLLDYSKVEGLQSGKFKVCLNEVDIKSTGWTCGVGVKRGLVPVF